MENDKQESRIGAIISNDEIGKIAESVLNRMLVTLHEMISEYLEDHDSK